MSFLHEPSRGGTRGGKDQFAWKDVEVDKHRENYLANSLMAPVGRWQKGKDLTWYTKDSKVLGKKERLKMEMAAVKQAEEEAMARALGIKPGSSIKPNGQLSKEEIAEVCKRRGNDEEEVPVEERMKGVGFKSSRSAMLMGSVSSVSKDGVTTFEHDPSQGGNIGRLVLKATTSHRRPVSTSSEAPPTPTPTISTNMQDVWVPVDSLSKKNKDKKKSKKRKEKHYSSDNERQQRKKRKSEHKQKKKHHHRARDISTDELDADSSDDVEHTKRKQYDSKKRRFDDKAERLSGTRSEKHGKERKTARRRSSISETDSEVEGSRYHSNRDREMSRRERRHRDGGRERKRERTTREEIGRSSRHKRIRHDSSDSSD